MTNRYNTLRANGRATVAIDQPLKRDINALAAADNKTAADFLRELIDKEKSQRPQGVMASMSPVSTIHSVDAKLDKLMGSPLMQALMSEEGSTGFQSEVAIAEGVRIYLKAIKSWPSWARDLVVSELSKSKQGEFKLA